MSGERRWAGRLPNRGTKEQTIIKNKKRFIFHHSFPTKGFALLSAVATLCTEAGKEVSTGRGNERLDIGSGIIITVTRPKKHWCAYITDSSRCGIRSCAARSHLPEPLLQTSITSWVFFPYHLQWAKATATIWKASSLSAVKDTMKLLVLIAKRVTNKRSISTVAFWLLMQNLFQARWHQVLCVWIACTTADHLKAFGTLALEGSSQHKLP